MRAATAEIVASYGGEISGSGRSPGPNGPPDAHSCAARAPARRRAVPSRIEVAFIVGRQASGESPSDRSIARPAASTVASAPPGPASISAAGVAPARLTGKVSAQP